jgi:hypothetical protein
VCAHRQYSLWRRTPPECDEKSVIAAMQQCALNVYAPALVEQFGTLVYVLVDVIGAIGDVAGQQVSAVNTLCAECC